MIFAITLISLFVISSIIGITFGIYGYASAKLWELTAKKMDLSIEDYEDGWFKVWDKRHYKYIGFRRYGHWDPKTDKWHRSIHFQFLDKYDKQLVRWNMNKGLW